MPGSTPRIEILLKFGSESSRRCSSKLRRRNPDCELARSRLEINGEKTENSHHYDAAQFGSPIPTDPAELLRVLGGVFGTPTPFALRNRVDSLAAGINADLFPSRFLICLAGLLGLVQRNM
ncbi:hypothetical protein SUNI508_06903 [Seiridium unicorne]|uniref:Uncharacterized protein n=1 Tax=Seiridium unicorne TaxID=138068 RepID=A0ABR2UZ57_9PEZI